MHIGFTVPKIKIHLEIGIIFLQIFHRYIQNVLPQGTIAGYTALQLKGGLHSFCLIVRILLGFCTGSRIYFLQLTYGKRRLLRVFSGIAFVKID